MAEEATEIAEVVEEPDDVPTPGLSPVVYRDVSFFYLTYSFVVGIELLL